MDFKQIKQEAKDVLVGNRLILLLVMIILGAISTALGAIIIGFVLIPIVNVALYYLLKHLILSKKLVVEKLYDQFKDFEHAIKMVAVGLLVQVITALGFILFIVPGIILGLRYSQALRIMAENKDLEILEALRKSKEMMDGHKMELFLFYLSFIGHFLLVIITIGLYGLYFMPYFLTCDANYYLHLSEQNKIFKQYLSPEYEIKDEDYN